MRLCLPLLALCLLLAANALAQVDIEREVECCDMSKAPQQVTWVGSDPIMSFEDLAAYCGPILWFSPDEPLNREVKVSADIEIPAAFPFQAPGNGPVVYYRVRSLVTNNKPGAAHVDSTNQDLSTVNLDSVSGIELDYFFYYPSEEGLGGHIHDVESVEMKIAVVRQTNCTDCRYALYVYKVNAKAHGIQWYDNTLTADRDTRFPAHILVEEGKHASCTDKNGDGYYTPSYDVTERVNDAWGVRDVMRSGALYVGGYQAWLTKVRNERDRVYPPLPADSPLLDDYSVDGVYMPGYNKYQVRPFPTVAEAMKGGDPSIERFVEKGYPDWPYMTEDKGFEKLAGVLDGEQFIKSVSISARFDNEVGISAVFPLLVFKHVNEPITGGWLVNRIYFKGPNLENFGWNIIYTPSASRWVDSYFSAGAEWDQVDGGTQTYFATEAGLKFRFNVQHSPVSFLSKVTDFWGVRAGIRYLGYKEFSQIGYVIEIGAGTF